MWTVSAAVIQRHIFKTFQLVQWITEAEPRDVSAWCQNPGEKFCCVKCYSSSSSRTHRGASFRFALRQAGFSSSLSVAFCVIFIYTTFRFSSGRIAIMGTFRGLITKPQKLNFLLFCMSHVEFFRHVLPQCVSVCVIVGLCITLWKQQNTIKSYH